MLKRLAETFAVLVFTVGLMAAGAGLYAWWGPESGEEPPQAVSIPTPTPIPHSPPPWASGTYTHPTGLWRIDYPEGWGVPGPHPPRIYGKTDSGLTEFVYFKSEPNGSIRVRRNWNDDYGDDLYAYAGLSLKEGLASEAPPELISFQRILIGGFPAYEAISTYVVDYLDPPEQRVKIQMWLFAGSQAFTIYGVLPLERWNAEGDRLTQIVHSFQPLDPSSAR
jgi:hypothetical protein